MPRLDPQPWMTAAATRRVMAALETERPGCARFVGGCVRNALLAAPVADIDIATQLTPDIVERVMRAAGIAVHPTGVEHGTLTVVADHQPFEVTTLRRDVETDGRRATVAFTEDWAEDAARRDFRMNALYAAPDGELFDPTGGGLDDVRDRRVAFVGDPETRIREDYLRVLRFFRFYAWYGRGEPDGAALDACNALKAGLKTVSAERIWMETKKLLAAPDPLSAIYAMVNSGVFAQLFPESPGVRLLSDLVSLERGRDVAIDPMLRFQSLFWKDAATAAAVARRLRMSNEERDRIAFAARCNAPLQEYIGLVDLRAILYRHGATVVRDNAVLAWAKDWPGPSGWPGVVALAEAYERPAMPVSGEDVMAAGVPPGPPVGEALRKLEAAWIASDFSVGREDLLTLLG